MGEKGEFWGFKKKKKKRRAFREREREGEKNQKEPTFRRLALRVVEVGRHRDHGLADAVAEKLARVIAELAEDGGRDLLGGELLVSGVGAVDLDVA